MTVDWTMLATAQSRILARVDRLASMGYGHVDEYVVLEIAPSGDHIKLRNSRGFESWYVVKEVAFVECLPIAVEPRGWLFWGR